MAGSIFVNDSFTFNGRVDATLGLHPSVRFTYRPSGIQARYAIEATTNPIAKIEAESKVIREHLRQFWVVNDDGEELMVLTPEQIQTLQPTIFRVMLHHILGYFGPSMVTEGNGSHGASA